MSFFRRTKFALFPVIVLSGILFFSLAVLAVDRMKSLNFLVAVSGPQISTATTTDFTFYIGDNINGVTNPLKSVFLEVSGIYSGGGSLGIMLNSDSNSLQTFTLPTVSNPTKFSILYKDPSGIMNPASAGEYTYSLNLNPSGVTISGLSAVAKVTYRYSPVACDDGQPTSEKVKTTNFLSWSSTDQISSATSTPFQIYLGDDISAVTNPIKSIFFEISGVYSGGGTLGVTVDGKSSTLQTLDFPTVTNATPFTVVYKDPTDSVNPTSAGVFDHTFDLSPSGVTISGLSVVTNLTNRYKPPSCGTGFPIYGDLTSAIIDIPGLGLRPAYNSIFWKGVLGGIGQNVGKVEFRFAASNDLSGPWNDANFVGGDSCTSATWSETSGPDKPIEIKCFPDLNNKRYFRYKVRICSNDCAVAGDTTPTVNDIVINWSP